MKHINNKGFTLIELIVAIVITGILGATIALTASAVSKNYQKQADQIQYTTLYYLAQSALDNDITKDSVVSQITLTMSNSGTVCTGASADRFLEYLTYLDASWNKISSSVPDAVYTVIINPDGVVEAADTPDDWRDDSPVQLSSTPTPTDYIHVAISATPTPFYTYEDAAVVGSGQGTVQVSGGEPSTIKSSYTGQRAWNALTYSATWTATLSSPGFLFDGWYSDAVLSEKVSDSTIYLRTDLVANNDSHIFYARFVPVIYNISYNLNGGSVTGNPSTYNVTQTFTLKNPVRTGYTFAGWTGSNGLTPQKTVTVSGATGDKSYTANWTTDQYTITYNLNGGTVAVANKTTYNVETDTFTLNNPTRPGYTFTGWTGSNGTTPSTSVSIAKGSVGNRTYTANWSPSSGIPYVVNHHTMNLDGSTYTLYASDSLTGSTNATVTPARKSIEGFTPPKGQSTVIKADGTTIIDYYYSRNKYTVTLTKGTGIASVSGAGTYFYGASVSVGAIASSGYVFTGWTGTYKVASFTMPASNVSMTANAQNNTFTVTYNANGGAGSMDAQTKTGGVNLTLSANGFTAPAGKDADGTYSYIKVFTGWNTAANGTGTAYAAGATYTGNANITLYAQWADQISGYRQIIQYSLKMPDGSCTAFQTVKDDYYAYGTAGPVWSYAQTASNQACNTPAYKVTGAKTQQVTVPLRQYTVTLKKGTGIDSVSGAGTYDYGTIVILSATASTGYKFNGWSLPVTDSQITVTGNVSYEALATINSYTSTFAARVSAGVGGASVTSTSITKPYGTSNISVTFTATIQEPYDKFDGWFNAAGTFITDKLSYTYTYTQSTANCGMTLYARFSMSSPAGYYNSAGTKIQSWNGYITNGLDKRASGGTLIIGEDWTAIPANRFAGTTLDMVVLHSNINTIGSQAFADTDCNVRLNTAKLTIATTLTDVGGNYRTSTVDLSNVTSFGAGAFVQHYTSIDRDNAYVEFSGSRCGNDHPETGQGGPQGYLVLNSKLTSIPDDCFNGCCLLTGDLIIPDTVQTIGNYAFQGCFGFNGKLNLGSSVTTIGDFAFAYCKQLGCMFNVYDDYPLYNISYSDVYGLKLEDKQLENIQKQGFVIHYMLPEIRTYTGWQSEPTATFKSAGSYGKDFELYACRLGQTYSPKWDTGRYRITYVVDFPKSLQSIGEHCFDSCRNIRIISLPEIAAYPEGCWRQVSNDLYISGYNMWSTVNFFSWVIPDTVKTVGARAFECILGLQYLYVPNTITNAGGGKTGAQAAANGYCCGSAAVALDWNTQASWFYMNRHTMLYVANVTSGTYPGTIAGNGNWNLEAFASYATLVGNNNGNGSKYYPKFQAWNAGYSGASITAHTGTPGTQITDGWYWRSLTRTYFRNIITQGSNRNVYMQPYEWERAVHGQKWY